MVDALAELENHVVVVGWDVFSEMIVRDLLDAKNEVAVITRDERSVEVIEEEFAGRPVTAVQRHLATYESFSDVDIEASLRVFVNLETDEENLVAILNMKKLYRDLQYVVVLRNDDLMQTFETAGVFYVISRFSIASKILTSYLYEEDVARLEADLLQATESADDYDMQQYLVTSENPYLGRTFGEVFWELKDDHNVVPIGISKPVPEGRDAPTGLRRKVHKGPRMDLPVEEGDFLILVLQGASEEAMEEIFGVTEGITRDSS